MDAGMPADTFWESTLNETVDFLESCARERKRKRKEKITDDFILAEAIAANFACLLPSDKKLDPPKPWDYHPRMFEEEKVIFEEADAKRKFEEYQEKRRKYFDEINRRRQKDSCSVC